MISTRARFAIHGLTFLAKGRPGEQASFTRLFEALKSWSDRLVLSKSYVSKIFQDLSRAGLVLAIPGRKGGYRLSRDPREISLLDVVEILDGGERGNCCLLADGRCSVQEACGVVSAIEKAEDAFRAVLRTTTLADTARGMPLPITVPVV
jgi:Rrf2 family protein